MRGVVSARCPHKEDDSSAPHAKALEPQLTVVLSVVFHRDHGKVEDGLEFCEIDAVLSEVLAPLRLVPPDHSQTVYAEWSSVKQIVDVISLAGVSQVQSPEVRGDARAQRRVQLARLLACAARGGRRPERVRSGPYWAAPNPVASYLSGSFKPGRSSSHAIELIFQPAGVRTNCIEIRPLISNGTPFNVPDLT